MQNPPKQSSSRRAHLRKKSRRAFSLVEVALALGIAAFALVAVFGLLPIGLTSNQNGVQQTVAAGIATSIASDLRATVTGSNQVSPNYRIPVPDPGGGSAVHSMLLGEDAHLVGTLDSFGVVTGATYRATLMLSAPPSGKRTATVVRIFVSWPPTVSGSDSAVGSFPVNYTGYFETMTALNRN